MSENLTTPNYWNKEWKNIKRLKILFADIFEKYLPRKKNLTCIEVGCVPGRFLAYLHKRFGYKIYGIDFADLSSTKKFFKEQGIKNYTLYKKDFTKFKNNKKFDVVCSFGFIEHFTNYTFIFKKHVELAKNKGIIIIEMPNFRYGQYYLHKIFDKPNLERHNLEIMNLNVLKNLCNKNKLKILHLNYYKTTGFWVGASDKHNIISKLLGLSISVSFKIISFLINIPNRYFSPYIVLVARKS